MLLLLPSFHSSVLFLCRESSSLFPSTCFLLQMGSSYVLGGSSMNSLSGGGTESGWTNYIGSSIQNSIYIEDADRPVVDQYYYNNNGGGYGSDDSMVSDASSGPTSQYSEAAPKKKGGVFSSRKGGKEKKKLGKQGNKQRDEYSRIKLGEDDDAKSAASHTGSKVRKAK